MEWTFTSVIRMVAWLEIDWSRANALSPLDNKNKNKNRKKWVENEPNLLHKRIWEVSFSSAFSFTNIYFSFSSMMVQLRQQCKHHLAGEIVFSSLSIISVCIIPSLFSDFLFPFSTPNALPFLDRWWLLFVVVIDGSPSLILLLFLRSIWSHTKR